MPWWLLICCGVALGILALLILGAIIEWVEGRKAEKSASYDEIKREAAQNSEDIRWAMGRLSQLHGDDLALNRKIGVLRDEIAKAGAEVEAMGVRVGRQALKNAGVAERVALVSLRAKGVEQELANEGDRVARLHRRVQKLEGEAAKRGKPAPTCCKTGGDKAQVKPHWANVHDAAMFHGVTDRTIQRWAADGKIKTQVVNGTRLYECGWKDAA